MTSSSPLISLEIPGMSGIHFQRGIALASHRRRGGWGAPASAPPRPSGRQAGGQWFLAGSPAHF